MNENLAIWHDPRPPYAYPLADGRIRVRLRLALSDDRVPTLHSSDRQNWDGPDGTSAMRWYADDDSYRYWEGDLHPFEGRVRYTFHLAPPSTPGGTDTWVGENGVTPIRPGAEWPDGYFHYPYLHPERRAHVPAWVRDAVAYEIFPDRFARGDPPVAADLASRWPGKPTYDAFWGGDLAGALDRLDYLSILGINLIWLTPIFAAPSNHKYDTTDYAQIDPHFGDDELFARLVSDAGRRQIRIVLDGVFNHVGAGFAPWHDVLARGSASRYWDWFDVQGERPDPARRNYRTFAQTGNMPRLRTANPEVQAYLIERAARWTRMGIAGWRLDVADEVDQQFWRHFRREIRAINPEAYLVGEIAYNPVRWLDGEQFDGAMNYPLRRALLQLLAPPNAVPGVPPLEERLSAPGFLATLGRLRTWSPDWALPAMLNPLSTHDVPRFLTAMGGDARRWRLGLLFQMAYEGIPLIYYGDEVGLEGGYDPDCRRPMIWDPAEQRADMLATTRELIRVRRQIPALRASGFRPIATDDAGVVAFVRGAASDDDAVGAALVLMNTNLHAVTVTLRLSGTAPATTPAWPRRPIARDLLTGIGYPVAGERLTLSLGALDAAILSAER